MWIHLGSFYMSIICWRVLRNLSTCTSKLYESGLVAIVDSGGLDKYLEIVKLDKVLVWRKFLVKMGLVIGLAKNVCRILRWNRERFAFSRWCFMNWKWLFYSEFDVDKIDVSSWLWLLDSFSVICLTGLCNKLEPVVNVKLDRLIVMTSERSDKFCTVVVFCCCSFVILSSCISCCSWEASCFFKLIGISLQNFAIIIIEWGLENHIGRCILSPIIRFRCFVIKYSSKIVASK